MTRSNDAIVGFLTPSGRSVGVGVLVGSGEVLTCAHVVNAALERDPRARDIPSEPVKVRFPLLRLGPQRLAHVARWFPPTRDGVLNDDLAVLLIHDDLPDGALPARLDAHLAEPGRTVDVFGYPGTPPRPDGGWVCATVRGSVGSGRLQLDAHMSAALRVQPGYSGSPVIDRETGAVVGLLVTAPHAETGDRDSYAMAADRIETLRGKAFPARRRGGQIWSVRLTAHRAAVLAVAFSPDGRTLATASTDRAVRLWHLPSRATGITLAQDTAVTSVTFSPDGMTLAVGDDAGTVRLYSNGGHGDATVLAGHTDAVTALAFHPNSRILAAGSADGIVVWDVATHATVVTIPNAGTVTSLTFGPDGEMLAIGNLDSVEVFDIGELKSRGRITAVRTAPIAFDPRKRMLATGDDDGNIWLWNGRGLDESTWFTAFASDGTIAISGNANDCTVANVGPAPAIDNHRSHTGAVTDLAFSSDGTLLASASEDNSVMLWIFEEASARSQMVGHIGAVHALAFSADGRLLATGGADGTIRLWDVPTQVNVDVLVGHADAVHSVAFGWADRMVASGSADRTMRLWNLRIHGAAYSFTGGDDDWAWCFGPQENNDDGEPASSIGTIGGGFENVKSVAFSPDGYTFAIAFEDNTVKVFNDTAGTEATLDYANAVRSVAFSPDGGTLCVDFGNSITLEHMVTTAFGQRGWGINGGPTVAIYPRSTNSVAFKPDGTMLASGDLNGTIWLWDAATRTTIAGFHGHGAAVNAVAFSADGTTLATASDDGTVQLWSLSSNAA